MGREIERKFLVKDDSWRSHAGEGVAFRQGYLSLDPGRSVRIREAGDRAFITIKGKWDGAGRDEFEYPIPAGDAAHLVAHLCIQPLIEKTRYKIRSGDLVWEIDEFAGQNRGLIVAEVELKDERQFIAKPDWVGIEVTGDHRYGNINLVRNPFSKW